MFILRHFSIRHSLNSNVAHDTIFECASNLRISKMLPTSVAIFSYTCDENYRFNTTGNQTHTITCGVDGTWSDINGHCVRKYIANAR